MEELLWNSMEKTTTINCKLKVNCCGHANIHCLRVLIKALLCCKILENLEYAEEVNKEVEKSYNKGVWNRNEQAKQQKMEAVVMKKEDSLDGDKKDKKIWSPKTWMKKIFLKKRSQSRDSFFESQEEVSGEIIDHYSLVPCCIYSCLVKLGRCV